MFRLSILFTAALVAWLAASAGGWAQNPVSALAPAEPSQAAPDPNVPPTIELTLAPAAEPRPALQYSLLPTEDERTPGNAAPHYYRAIVMQQQLPKEHSQLYVDKYRLWEQATGADYPKEEVAKWLGAQENILKELRLAAHREYCDWDFRLQDLRGLEMLSFLLPEIQECRSLARTLRVKARYEILDGRPKDALETLRIGYQLGRDSAQASFLVSALVGVAICNMMNEELLLLMRHSDQNYYWALAALPDPLIDLRPAMEFEMHFPQQMFPFLIDAETTHRSPDEWRRLIVECMQGMGAMSGGANDSDGWYDELAVAAFMAKLYPAAKEALIAGGMTRERVEAMPVAQVVAIQTARTSEYAFQEVFKVWLLPYPEASRRIPEIEQKLEDEGILRLAAALSGKAGLPLASLLLPAVSQVMQAEVRLARNLAALRAIEALRMHAAANGGKLPQSLAEVTVVPVPENPATNQPFAYAYDAAAGTATLEVPPIGGLPPQHDAKRYVIRLKK
ncbi:MAG: hypothetical protein WD872_03455 [Pirellulaceae bacterium]